MNNYYKPNKNYSIYTRWPEKQKNAEEKMYTMGEVSKITGVPRETLKFYAKIGLFVPKYVNPENKYKYYSYDQFWEIDIITCCRSLDISIAEIKEIIASKNNDEVVKLMKKHQEIAEQRSCYYAKVAEDIQWYADQQEMIKKTNFDTEIELKQLPERTVVYGKNAENVNAYHLKLQQAIFENTGKTGMLRRSYGFVLDPQGLQNDLFKKECEYLTFLDTDATLENFDSEDIMKIPAGMYACCKVNVRNGKADFSALRRWLRKNDVEAKYVVADEIGLQLYVYLNNEYPCEVKVLLSQEV